MRTRPALVRVDPAFAAVTRHGDQRQQVATRVHGRGVVVDAVPRQGQGEQTRVTGRGLDRRSRAGPARPLANSVDCAPCSGPFHMSIGLGHATGDDRDGMDPQMPPDGRMRERRSR